MKELKASLETIRATAHELITTIDGHLAQLQQQRQTQQEQPQAAEQPDPDSVFSKLSPKQQQEMTASVKAMLQTLIEVDLKSTGEVSQGTKEAAQAQGFCFEKKGGHVMSNNDVPIWEKYTLTIEEASKYFRIGENKLRRLAEENPTAGWVILNGNRIQIKRKQFEKIIDSLDTI